MILLDEPTASLDAATRADVLADVEHLRERGKTVLLISHRPEEVRQLALRAIWTLLQRELRDSLRNKWFLLYTLSFAGLGGVRSAQTEQSASIAHQNKGFNGSWSAVNAEAAV